MNKFDIQDLDLYYGSNQALKKINLPIPNRQVTALIGPSGCGKSTLLRCLNRMNDLIEGVKIDGNLTMDGENVYGNIDVSQLRIKVGMVFQKPNPFPMSIYENVAYGLRAQGNKDKKELDKETAFCSRCFQQGDRLSLPRLCRQFYERYSSHG